MSRRLTLREPTERAEIEAFLRGDLDLHPYELGDLDPFFWPRTRWVGASEEGTLRALALVYRDPAGHETLLLLERRDPDAAAWLLEAGASRLPPRCYAHLSVGLAERFPRRGEPRGLYRKFALAELGGLGDLDEREVVALGPPERAEVEAFYREAYPGNWFEPSMLETGCYRGLRVGGALRCVAGVHVYAPGQGVAALGNIATHPAARGAGLARRVTGALCRELVGQGLRVGLNVAAGNAPAIACYTRLGFRPVADYEEWQFAPA